MKRGVLKNPHMGKRAIQAFQAVIYASYEREKRDFPWRRTRDPYPILVSEIMLQQTQAGPRTVTKYEAFLETFPHVHALAQAPLSHVLRLWQGLGYNRRAKALRDAAQIIVERYKGKVPRTEAELVALPGVGPYTAAAVMAFAFDKPVVMIETNIRTVYLHHFFKNSRQKISDTELVRYIEQTLDTENPRRWYTALMDYGAMLKKEGKGNEKSRHYVRQAAFKGSVRELRGKILRELALKSQNEIALKKKLNDSRSGDEIQKLIRDGLIARRGKTLKLAD